MPRTRLNTTRQDGPFTTSTNAAPPQHDISDTSVRDARTSATTDCAGIMPAWRKYVHLYAPLITMTHSCILHSGSPTDPSAESAEQTVLLTASTAIPTLFLASLFYPTDRPESTPEESIRFMRKHDAYRAGMIATYGRIYDTFKAVLIVSLLIDSPKNVPRISTSKVPCTLLCHFGFLEARWYHSLLPVNISVIGLLVGAVNESYSPLHSLHCPG